MFKRRGRGSAMFGGSVKGSTISNVTFDGDVVLAGNPAFGRCHGASFTGLPDGRTKWSVVAGGYLYLDGKRVDGPANGVR